MKKIRKRFLGLLLTCVMVLLPVSQALAAVSYDAAAGGERSDALSGRQPHQYRASGDDGRRGGGAGDTGHMDKYG